MTVKGELCELIETLLDLQQQYTAPNPSSDTLSPPTLAQRVQPLLPLLLSSYGASLSKADQSMLRLLLHINDIVYHSEACQQQLHVSRHDPEDAVPAVSDDGGYAGTTAGALTAPDASRAAVGAKSDAAMEQEQVLRTEGSGLIDGPICARLHGPLAQAG